MGNIEEIERLKNIGSFTDKGMGGTVTQVDGEER